MDATVHQLSVSLPMDMRATCARPSAYDPTVLARQPRMQKIGGSEQQRMTGRTPKEHRMVCELFSNQVLCH